MSHPTKVLSYSIPVSGPEDADAEEVSLRIKRSNRATEREERAAFDVRNFLDDVAAVCRLHGMVLGVGYDELEVSILNEDDARRLLEARDARLENLPVVEPGGGELVTKRDHWSGAATAPVKRVPGERYLESNGEVARARVQHGLASWAEEPPRFAPLSAEQRAEWPTLRQGRVLR